MVPRLRSGCERRGAPKATSISEFEIGEMTLGPVGDYTSLKIDSCGCTLMRRRVLRPCAASVGLCTGGRMGKVTIEVPQ
jgi:hypothetical protein